MKKRVMALLCVSAILLSLSAAGCAKNENKDQGQTSQASSAASSTASEISTSSEQEQTAASDSTQKKVVFSVDGQKIYNSGAALYVIKDNDTFEYVELAADSESSKSYEGHAPEYVSFTPQQVVTGKDAFFFDKDRGVLSHADLSDLKNVKKDVVYTAEKAMPVVRAAIEKNTEISDEDLEKVAYSLFVNSSTPLADGGDGFIYGAFIPSSECYEQSKPVAYQIYRIAKDGSAFEFVGGDSYSASSFVIKDGYIYYYDGGYTYDKDKKDAAIDLSRVGIYKMKIDGSDRKELYKTKLTANVDGDPVEAMKCSGRLDIVGSKLYFIPAASQLYKMGLDGEDPTKVTENYCNNYYIDEQAGILYYCIGKYMDIAPQGFTVVSVPLRGGEEKQLYINTNQAALPGTWTSDGNYIYLSNNDGYAADLLKDVNDDGSFELRACGRRWNLNEGYMEVLYCVTEIEYDEGSFGEKSVKRVGDTTIKWQKDD